MKDLVKHFKEHRLRPLLLPVDLWATFDRQVKSLLVPIDRWKEIEYLNSIGDYGSEVENIPNDVGGIYVFYIDSGILPQSGHSILCYIGRAHKPPSNSLKARIKSYKDYSDNPEKFERPKIRDLFDMWNKYIRCRYFPMLDEYSINGKSGNDLIDQVEAELINQLLPPYNDKIPNKQIANATIRAF